METEQQTQLSLLLVPLDFRNSLHSIKKASYIQEIQTGKFTRFLSVQKAIFANGVALSAEEDFVLGGIVSLSVDQILAQRTGSWHDPEGKVYGVTTAASHNGYLYIGTAPEGSRGVHRVLLTK